MIPLIICYSIRTAYFAYNSVVMTPVVAKVPHTVGPTSSKAFLAGSNLAERQCTLESKSIHTNSFADAYLITAHKK